MVERIDGQGQYFREISPKIGVVSRENYRLIWFRSRNEGYPDNSLIPGVLQRLSGLPDFDRDSFLVDNTYDELGRFRHVLAIPIECPGVLPEDDINGPDDLPNPNETYLALVWEENSEKPLEILVLSNDVNRVVGIAMSRARRIVGNEWLGFEVEFSKITPEKFIEEAKKQIDNGIEQPGFILRFAGLGRYQKMRLEGGSEGERQLSA